MPWYLFLALDSTVVLNSGTAFKKNKDEKNDNAYKYYQRAYDQWIENSESKPNSNLNKSLNSNACHEKLYELYYRNNDIVGLKMAKK